MLFSFYFLNFLNNELLLLLLFWGFDPVEVVQLSFVLLRRSEPLIIVLSSDNVAGDSTEKVPTTVVKELSITALIDEAGNM